MKKPKDVPELASRLMSAATAPLVVSAPVAVAPPTQPPPIEEAALTVAPTAGKGSRLASKARKAPNRTTVSVFLRIPGQLFEKYDQEAVRRTKATGRGVTVQQVMLDWLDRARPSV